MQNAPPHRYTAAAIAELYTDVSKHLQHLNAHSNVSVRAVTLPSDQEIASLVQSRATFLPEKYPVSALSHLGKLVGSVSHTSAIDEATIHGNGVSSIGETISMSNALVKRLYGVFDQDLNGAIDFRDEFVQAASVEPLVLEALSKPLTFNRHTNFQLRQVRPRSFSCAHGSQSLRCITERLKLDWSVMLSILEDVNDATRLDRDAAAHDRAWLVKTNQADPAPYEAVAAPLTSAQFHNIMFEYLHEPQAEDGHTLQDLFKAYVPQQAPADPTCSRFYFRFFDYDCDGEITREELSSVVCSSFGSMGHELLETMRLLQGIDTNGDGELTKEEYLEAAKKNPLLLASIYICI
ncbi:hypothetical protein DYB32_004606 [Aphanomyces invadans]|uniref:EF-hand domain-containing protein n=1 Tax=Aphanomyces invadans TaxID=157072 RepID=A0A3R6VXS9_9STRA|nr:hypothetical protein DYB32_004606 [Aphanomyces invadans]